LAPSAAGRLPSTLTETLLARLDALDDSTRSLLQIASVIGSDFDAEILSHVAARPAAEIEATLQKLQHVEIVVRASAGRADYSFKHVPMRDVAYGTLLSRRRHELHRTVADAILASRAADDSIDLVAYHLSQSDD